MPMTLDRVAGTDRGRLGRAQVDPIAVEGLAPKGNRISLAGWLQYTSL